MLGGSSGTMFKPTVRGVLFLKRHPRAGACLGWQTACLAFRMPWAQPLAPLKPGIVVFTCNQAPGRWRQEDRTFKVRLGRWYRG